MRTHPKIILLLIAVLVFASGCKTTPRPKPTTADSPTLADFKHRVTVTRNQLNSIVAAAQAVADRNFAHPNSLIDIQYSLQPGFAEELLNRSGGLAAAGQALLLDRLRHVGLDERRREPRPQLLWLLHDLQPELRGW